MSGKQVKRREEWRQRIGEQEKSGLSIRAYCKQYGIAEHTFYGWRQRLRADERVGFAVVRTTPSTEETQPIELLLAGGERLRIPCDEAMLAMVLRVLRTQQ